jgi:hypothetical protein
VHRRLAQLLNAIHAKTAVRPRVDRLGQLDGPRTTGTAEAEKRAGGLRRSWLILTPSVLAAVALLLGLCDVTLVVTNRYLRQQTIEQGQFLQQSAQLGRIRDNLVRLMARGAVEENDLPLRDLLTSNGYHIESGNPAVGPQPKPPIASALGPGEAPIPAPAPTPTKR